MKILHFAAAILILISPVASAQNLDATQQYKRCPANAASMADSRRCDSEELDRQKALLTAEYKIITAGASPSATANLDKAQKAWVTYRDLDCKAKSSAIPGSGASDAYFECMLQHIRVRKLQLENYWSL
ncbi:lysozyme inhibitor LprI family protein [Lysobacter soyae]|uniref:DUF1311 domain-containing protein n=1 Tax=Lysobacter soyae TaxID=2764185 RepID=A0ABX8WNZ0_9GAMM|nr:lysozyme inhibitor LprI family protein [Lysobacter sp. CJ11]QYR52967.1 DUF1311 domain-containing protein [Lysobacter sp. CJ11]